MTDINSTAATITRIDTSDDVLISFSGGGSITINGEQISVSGAVTLNGLRDLINADADSSAAASVIQTAPWAYSLVLTSKETREVVAPYLEKL